MKISGIWLLLGTFLLAIIFVLFRSGPDFGYVIPGRLTRLVAIIIGGVCIAYSSVIFQTLVGNRILTPAVMGYEGVFLLLQSILTLVLGGSLHIALGKSVNFGISLLVMLIYSSVLHHLFFKDGRKDVHFLLLLGLVLSMILGTLSQFVQLSTSPGEFGVIQSFIYATFNRAQPEQIAYAALLMVPALMIGARSLPILDVIALGREQAISLGVDYKRYVRLYLFLISVLVAISTSLIGPTAFMGIFIANVSYSISASSKHRATLITGCLVAIAVFILAQFLIEHLFNYTTTVSILINMICGSYFLLLMVRAKGRT